jgi:hypothetical protein
MFPSVPSYQAAIEIRGRPRTGRSAAELGIKADPPIPGPLSANLGTPRNCNRYSPSSPQVPVEQDVLPAPVVVDAPGPRAELADPAGGRGPVKAPA